MQNYEPIFNITPEILNSVYEIAANLERIDIIRERTLTPQLRKENRIKTIHSSLWIEANSLTLQQVTDIVNGKRVAGLAKDILEVKNAIIAYDELLGCNPYNEKDLLRQHKLLMNGLVDDAGKYRNAGVGVFAGKTPVHIAPPQSQVPVLVFQLLEWVKNAKLPQVVKSCIFHYEFEFIHPFMDGNGRMGRMWQTLLLYQENPIFAWLPVETIVAYNQQEYYKAIRRSTHNNDSGIFAAFMLSAIKQATADFKEKHHRGEIQIATQNVTDNVVDNVTDPREKMIVDLIKTNYKISMQQIALKCGVTKMTISRDIAKLKEKGVLARVGKEKSGYWSIKQ
ncbi:cell filamentation protein Fic [Campylobacterota bacterium]|nr:cell filamentation protein Fic [Campylobacterota bacterium]